MPQVEVTYSHIYDMTLANISKRRYQKAAWKKATAYSKHLRKMLADHKGVLKAMEDVSKLRWKERKITVYLVNAKYSPISFSSPLTLKMYKDPRKAFGVLVHELIHNILSQNWGSVSAAFHSKYAKENMNVRIHILVGAILVILNERLFKDSQLDLFKYDRWDYAPYKRALNIINRDGARNIVEGAVRK